MGRGWWSVRGDQKIGKGKPVVRQASIDSPGGGARGFTAVGGGVIVSRDDRRARHVNLHRIQEPRNEGRMVDVRYKGGFIREKRREIMVVYIGIELELS